MCRGPWVVMIQSDCSRKEWLVVSPSHMLGAVRVSPIGCAVFWALQQDAYSHGTLISLASCWTDAVWPCTAGQHWTWETLNWLIETDAIRTLSFPLSFLILVKFWRIMEIYWYWYQLLHFHPDSMWSVYYMWSVFFFTLMNVFTLTHKTVIQ